VVPRPGRQSGTRETVTRLPWEQETSRSTRGCPTLGLWRSLVARRLGRAKVPGSSPGRSTARVYNRVSQILTVRFGRGEAPRVATRSVGGSIPG
jgi:hypothetical protein